MRELFRLKEGGKNNMPKKYSVQVPGKVMIAGEWFVLRGAPCIVTTVNRHVNATIFESEESSVIAKNLDQKTRFMFLDNVMHVENRTEQLEIALYTIGVVFEYLTEQSVDIEKQFTIEIDSSEFSVHNKKIGIGSSAAVVVAIIRVMFNFYGCYADNKIIFKLACFANMIAHDNLGSCFDIAASVYGKTLWYKQFDTIWFSNQLREDLKYSEMAEKEWPGLEIEPIDLPEELKLLVGFVGKSADTFQLVKMVKPALYSDEGTKLCEEARELMQHFRKACESNDTKQFLELINQNSVLLQKLFELSGVELETPKLTMLIETAKSCGAAAKFSGAGGGDCGIAVCPDNAVAACVRGTWQTHNISVL